jgi:hypothetical protein
MTCKDKLERVFSGEIRQTIRRGERYQVGDTLTIFEWTGTPYRSKWGRRIEETVVEVFPVIVGNCGLGLPHSEESEEPMGWLRIFTMVPWDADPWYARALEELAMHDGLTPPTGVHLKEVLFAMYPECDFEKGEIFQVVRW